MISLPIDSYLPLIISTWKEKNSIIINASAGSGKTTRLPWALAQNSDKKIIVLEPRKLAAKMAALRIAQENNLCLGKEIGYAYRDDINFTQESKLIFFTEGTFLRFIEDPVFIESIGTVIFDEFHERHLDTDLALALMRNKKAQYPDLKMILMSATIETAIATTLDATVIEINARLFEVKTHYLPNVTSILNQELSIKILNTIKKLPLDGDILIFLPGMREILRTQELINSSLGTTYILHSEIEKNEQEKIMISTDHRKIILATNIAESSLTIAGIKFVIDSGISRVSEFNPWTGFKTLVDRPITQSSAIQRMYRAGRTQNGECFRLYSEFDYQQREKFSVPEILTTQLFDTFLVSAYYHHQLHWITPPPMDKWKQAETLNKLLGTINEDGTISKTGHFALNFNLSIRIAKILYQARELSSQVKKELIDYLARVITKEDPKYLHRRLRSFTKGHDSPDAQIDFAKLVLSGMIDQVAKFRSGQHDFIHYSGKILRPHQKINDLQDGLYILTSINHRGQVEEVLPINEEWLIELEPYPLKESTDFNWDERSITRKLKTSIGSIILEETSQKLSWSDFNVSEKEKFLQKNKQRLETVTAEFINSTVYQRAQFYLKKMQQNLNFTPDFKTLLDLFNADLALIKLHLPAMLQEQLAVNLDQYVPESIRLNNKNYPINYQGEPSIQGHIQEFFGIKLTPTIMNDTPLTLILLGPHKRPIQYTKDLSGFWQRTYQELLKEWKREYPRHFWPDNPLVAPPVLLKRQLPIP